MYKTILSIALSLMTSMTMQGAKTVTSAQAKLVGDGQTLNTQAIQHAIDQLSAKGGGTLRLLPGRYVSGAIMLKSNVELHLDKDAVLLGSTNPDDYGQAATKQMWESNNIDGQLTLALLKAQDAENIKLTGEGVVNGRGREVAINIDSLHFNGTRHLDNYDKSESRPDEQYRPTLISFTRCRNVEVSGLTFTNSACWGLMLHKCDDVRMHHLNIINRAYWNNDGFDLVDCRRVEVGFCHVNSADDGLCLKSEDARDICDSIYVHDCSVESSASGIKFGTASFGGFTNIHFARIKVSNTFRSAVAIEGVDGGVLKNILMEDIDAFNVGNPIFIRLGKRNGKRTASVSDITIRRMYCDMAFERPDKGYDMRGPIKNTMINPIPSSITGMPDAPVRNVTIEDMTLVYPGDASKGLHYIPTWNLDRVPEQAARYPEFDMFGELPSYGFFVRHADGITFRNVQIKLKKDDFRPAFVLDDAKNVKFEHVTYPLGKTSGQIFDSNGVNKQ